MKTSVLRYSRYLTLLLLMLLGIQSVIWLAIGKPRLLMLFAADISATVGNEIQVSRECFNLDAEHTDRMITQLEREYSVRSHTLGPGEVAQRPDGRLKRPLVCSSRFVNTLFYAEYRWGVSRGNMSGEVYRSRYVYILGAWIPLGRGEVIRIASIVTPAEVHHACRGGSVV